MSNLIFAVFENEERAYEGASVLRSLHRDSALTICGAAIVARNHDGSIRIRDAREKGPIGTAAGTTGPIGTALGMLTGAIIGTIGGPGGVVTGAAIGGLVGAGVDNYNLAVGDVFVDEIASQLQPGKVAIVAEIEEPWITPLDVRILDVRMAELGVEVNRRSRLLFEDEVLERDAAAAKAEYEGLKDELATTHAENKAAVQAKLDAASARLTETLQKSEARHQQAMQQGEAELAALVEQSKNAVGEKRAEIEAEIAGIRERNALRNEKLGAAWKLTKEALAA